MSGGIYASLSGAIASLRDVEVIANNVANVDTAGFRRDQTQFQTILGAALGFASADTGRIDLRAGAARPTQSPLHAAIEGDGFFVVATSAGERYTRRGDFVLSASGVLSLPSGEPVLGTAGPIQIPPNVPVSLASDGSVVGPGGVLGQLRIVRFDGPEALAKAGLSTLAARDGAQPQSVATPQLAVGHVETSNVNLSGELVSLILAQRSVEASMNALRVNDEMTQALIQVQR
jgi:flagellar basal body rod protein FlgG